MNTKATGYLLLTLTLVLGLSPASGCTSRGGRGTNGQAGLSASRGGGDGYSPATAWHACFDTRSDYRRVAAYQCRDGSTPLRGDIALGGRARVGNIGAGPDGHILDHYQIPCPEGMISIYVDGYHCAEEMGELSEAEIRAAFEGLQQYATAPDVTHPSAVQRGFRAATQLGMEVPTCRHVEQAILPGEQDHPTWREQGAIYMAAVMAELYPHRQAYTNGTDPILRYDFEGPALRRGAWTYVQTNRRLFTLPRFARFRFARLDDFVRRPDAEVMADIDDLVAMCSLERVTPGIRLERAPN